VVPSDKSLHEADFFIPGPFLGEAEDGDLVEIEISEKNN
jgi:hypothetical protein